MNKYPMLEGGLYSIRTADEFMSSRQIEGGPPHQQRLQQILVRVGGKATGVEEALLQDQLLRVGEVYELQEGAHGSGSLSGGDGIH